MAEMTDAQYVAHEGLRCPFCESRNVQSNAEYTLRIEDHLTLTMHAWCDDCKTQWRETFKLTGYHRVQE
jgi:transposase-like protein